MNGRLKHRIVGAIVLIVLAIACLPLLLNNPTQPLYYSIKKIFAPFFTAGQSPDHPEVLFIYENEDNLTPHAGQPKAPLAQPLPTKLIPATAPVVPNPTQDAAPSTATTPNVPIATTPHPPSSASLTTTAITWQLQAASFTLEANAQKLTKQLKKQGLPAFYQAVSNNKKTTFRVFISPIPELAQAQKLQKELKETYHIVAKISQVPTAKGATH